MPQQENTSRALYPYTPFGDYAPALISQTDSGHHAFRSSRLPALHSAQLTILLIRRNDKARGRRAMQAIGIHQCIPQPFQDTGSKSLLPEPFRNLDGRFVQSNIRILQHLLVCYHNQYFILFIKHLKF